MSGAARMTYLLDHEGRVAAGFTGAMRRCSTIIQVTLFPPGVEPFDMSTYAFAVMNRERAPLADDDLPTCLYARLVWWDDRCDVYSVDHALPDACALWVGLPDSWAGQPSSWGTSQGCAVKVRPPTQRPPSMWALGHWPAGLTMRDATGLVAMAFPVTVVDRPSNPRRFEDVDGTPLDPADFDWLKGETPFSPDCEPDWIFAVKRGVAPAGAVVGTRVLVAVRAEGYPIKEAVLRSDVEMFPVVLP